jgi:hypothetical protein
MKKGLVIVVLLALSLCAVVAIGGGAFYYFFLRQTPEKAYSEAIAKFEEGEYYQFETTADITLDIETPDYPEYNDSSDIAVTNTGKVDIQNDKIYIKSETDTEGVSQTSEFYNIGDNIYVKAGGGDFSQYTEEEAREQGVSGGDRNIEISNSLTGDEEYSLLAEETVEGEDCYHYKVTLDKSILDQMIDDFVLSMEKSGNLGIEAEDVEIENATIEIWISKSQSSVIKSITRMDKMGYTGEEEGVRFILAMTNIEISTIFSNWDEVVEIVAPV